MRKQVEGQEEQARALWRGQSPVAKPEPKGRRSLRAGDRTNSNKQGSTVQADREGSGQGTSSSGSSEHPENGCWGVRFLTVRRGVATPPSETGGRAFSDEGMD